MHAEVQPIQLTPTQVAAFARIRRMLEGSTQFNEITKWEVSAHNFGLWVSAETKPRNRQPGTIGDSWMFHDFWAFRVGKRGAVVASMVPKHAENLKLLPFRIKGAA